ncbi:EAL domain-containing protein [Nitrosomonas sp. JL21]|uniref:EAL domain-containing protein n=1 Tax=Nitrosomonas sp. JL21 TaxID=153949 RepID=UPI00136F9425|nr:EAL domain-containing protein [Nitrosomonas sp. JL21]MBL8496388.1 EAL domain-containing protein [Nitrosomonas sp.]MXS77340.1 EAL domain-containing protein [Nitrosomonas sp. JL21]
MNEPIKILIVEDETIVALDLKRRLTKLGYHITGTAANSDKVLALINQEVPSLVLMDIHIQGSMDGIEVVALLQKTHHIPIVYLTAFSEEKTLARAKTTKPYGYLLKPFSDRELHIIIQVSLERFECDIVLKKNEQHFRLALEAANLGTWEMAADSQDIILNKTPHGGALPLPDWNSVMTAMHDDDKHKLAQFIDRLRSSKGKTADLEFQVDCGSETPVWYKLYGKSFSDAAADQPQIVGILQNTTESRSARNKLAQAATVFECAAEGIIILNEDKRFDRANNAFFSMTGFEHHDLINKELPFLNRFSLGEDMYNKIWLACHQNGQWQGEVSVLKKNMDSLYAWLNIGLIHSDAGTTQQFVVMISDITVIRETTEQLSHIAYYDSLTNLPNRMLIMDRLKQALAVAIRESSMLGVLFIDLDNFKRINDTLGHNSGDTLLCFVSHRMLSVLRQCDTLGRLGGDEFIVIVSRAESNDALIRVAEKILESLAMPVIVENMEIIPSCSIGISAYPDHSAHPEELLQMADTAMYEAKNKGRNNYAFYHSALTQKAAHHLTREQELHHALAKQQFMLFYQPQFSPTEKRITGVEALIRWQHPTKGLLLPIDIIPVAETSRLIIEIGNWVLTEACKQLSQWHANGLSDLRIAVNISIRQLADKNFHNFIAKLLYQYALPAHLLELEVTESCLQDELIYINCLEQLENLGLSISIDDFGTGYSCLSSLKNLPIHRLKIDQSFVKGIPEDDNDCAIAAAIMVLAQKLGLQVIAEGIEAQEQIAFLTELGCNELQGYLLSKPVAPEYIPGLIKNSPIRPNT